MQSSRTITEQFEELIRKAKTLNKTHPVLPDHGDAKHNKLISAEPEISMLQKRYDMCVVQKNAIKDLIKLHKEELELLESALRTIESEERNIAAIILRETQEDDSFARTTSVEMVERDNDSVSVRPIAASTQLSAAPTFENLDSNGPEYSSDSYSYKQESDTEEAKSPSDDYSEQENDPLDNASRKPSSERRVRFSMEDLGTHSDRTLNPSPVYNKNTARPTNSFKGTISIPQRYNYIRNRNSSLMKEISIKKILDGNRKPDMEDNDQDQRALVRKLHTLYSSRR
ncbi:hypothetical protein OIY81_2228 [Cryptosporidium canis]|uniref:Uncharacterized protein n=1 Tax=Cryptosporidium canis TaxID=195482 RepID=A0ABQ8P8B9_9CRYT|nr:hypothetical protein OJ252_2168 [Cryptosporidium canis]KAJ1609769.1 hypothetical protein OIY81_2228 [Cryptosporidium canis]